MLDIERNAVVFLLGAGASAQAGIPHSGQMIEDIERKILGGDNSWSQYKDLYNCVQGGIFASEGIDGRFSSTVNYNIEKLVDTLEQIGMHDRHALFPFVETWNKRLIEVAGERFHLVSDLRRRIEDALRYDWLVVKDFAKDAEYFHGLFDFQRQYQHPLPVFSLNYDLCVEKIAELRKNVKLERGFNDERIWDLRQFEEYEHEKDPKDIYLYKLHGSLDWTFDEKGQLTFHDQVTQGAEVALIFGTSSKVDYREPFHFLTFEFRRRVNAAQLLVAVGYGFGDNHINTIIQQALKNDSRMRLLVVAPHAGCTEKERLQQVSTAISHFDSRQIDIADITAKDFMQENLSAEYIRKRLPAEDNSELPF